MEITEAELKASLAKFIDAEKARTDPRSHAVTKTQENLILQAHKAGLSQRAISRWYKGQFGYGGRDFIHNTLVRLGADTDRTQFRIGTPS